MSLIPRLPCRKLFIDSRFGEGNATEFTVEIPQGGLDLPDNCVAFIDQISVPSFQNVFTGRHLLYTREEIDNMVRFQSFPIEADNHTTGQFIQAINTALAPQILSNTVTASNNFQGGIQFAMTGPETETLRILTDAELALIDDPSDAIDISGTYFYPTLDFTGGWQGPGTDSIQVTDDPTAAFYFRYRFDSEVGTPIKPHNRFYVFGNKIYLDPQNTTFEANTTGVLNASKTAITWELGVSGASLVWNSTGGAVPLRPISGTAFLISALENNGVTPSKTYSMDLSTLLPDGVGLSNTDPVRVPIVEVRNVNVTQCDLFRDNQLFATFPKQMRIATQRLFLQVCPLTWPYLVLPAFSLAMASLQILTVSAREV